jgi:hypothetical protein
MRVAVERTGGPEAELERGKLLGAGRARERRGVVCVWAARALVAAETGSVGS